MLEKLPDALGHALRGQRAGLDKIAFRAVDLRAGMASIAVTSLAFVDHAPIPDALHRRRPRRLAAAAVARRSRSMPARWR